MFCLGADHLRVQGAAGLRGAVHGEPVVPGLLPSPPSLVIVRCHPITVYVVTSLVSNLVQKTRSRHQIPAITRALDKYSPLVEGGRRNSESGSS